MVTKKSGTKKPTTLALARALAKGERKPYRSLLSTWRKTPSRALGDLLVCHASPTGKVAAALNFEGLSTRELTQRVSELARLPRDPRVASALCALVEAPPFTSQAMKPMWNAAFEQLVEKHYDPRSSARLRTVDIGQSFGATNMSKWMRKQIDATLEALEQRDVELGRPPRYEAGVQRLVDAAWAAAEAEARSAAQAEDQPATPKGTGDELLAAVLAAPEDDAPRLVYADWLDNEGESARAELIQLQIQRAREGGVPGERELKLVAKHAAKWLAPIVPVLKKGSWEFERGFLDTCTIYPRKGKAAELAGHPLWATVRHATLSETGDPAPIVTHPVMNQLRSIRLWTYPRGLAGLLDSDAPIEELHHVYLPNVIRDDALWELFVRCPRLPELRLVQIGGAQPEHLLEIAAGGMARPGLRIVYAMHGYELRPFWTALLEVPGKQPQHTLATHSMELELDRTTRTMTCTLEHTDAVAGLWDVALAIGLAGANQGNAPAGVLRELVVRVPRGGVQGELGWGPIKKPAAMLEALETRCGELAYGFRVIEGEWPTRYVGHHPVRL
jgi:uncharacterized protein (TIGR02996 family)